MTTIDVTKLPTEVWDIERLKPSPTNSKKHPPEHVELLAKSIAKHGIANTIQVEPDGFIIVGHGRWLAAKFLSWKTVSVIVRHDLSKEQAAALRVADNKTVSTDYDTELLKAELLSLKDSDYDMSTLGFGDAELEKLTADFGNIDDNVFVDDIGEAVETQKAENVAKAAEIDKSAAPVGDALGFKRVTIEQSRRIREAMTRIAPKFKGMEQSPAEILIAVLEDF
jgi:hypothetical protein